MFVMDIRAAVKFVTRLKGQKPTIVRDKIVDAAFERYKQLNAEKSGASIAPSTLDALDLASKVKLQSAQELGDAYAQIELLAQRGKQGAATSFEQGQHWARCIEGFRKEIPALEDRKAQSARAELGAMRREVETLEKRVAEECAEKLASRQFANQETGRANLAEAALNALKQSGQGYEKLKAAHEALKTDYNDRVKRGEETLKRHKEQVEGLTASWQTERDARIEAEAKLSAEQKARANIGIDLKKLEDQIAASQEAIKFLEDALKAANDKLGGVAELAYGGRGEIERRLISHYEHGGKQEAADNIRARQAARHQKSQSYRNGEQLSLLNGRGNKAA
jgi:chromosome segregation ATPase